MEQAGSVEPYGAFGAAPHAATSERGGFAERGGFSERGGLSDRGGREWMAELSVGG